MISAIIKKMEDIVFKGILSFEFYREIHGLYSTTPIPQTWPGVSSPDYELFVIFLPVTTFWLQSIVKLAGTLG